MLNMNTQEHKPKKFTFVWTFELFDPNQLLLNLIEKNTSKKRRGGKKTLYLNSKKLTNSNTYTQTTCNLKLEHTHANQHFEQTHLEQQTLLPKP